MEYSVGAQYVILRAMSEAKAFSRGEMRMEHLFLGLLKLSQLSCGEIAPAFEDKAAVDGDIAAVAKLVENAIAYSAQGTVVSVLVTRASSPERAMVQVVDRGCGIAKDECPRVFERFYRGSNQNHRTSEGIGLGLAIVKHVSLTHHGSVSVWSAPGQGSTFTMSLPVAQ